MLSEVEELPLKDLAAAFDMGRTAISKHLAVLKEAGLVSERKVGRETRFRLTPGPLQEIQDWVSHYEQFWNVRLARLKSLLEKEQ